MSCDWEGNRKFAVALAIRYRLEWFIHLRAQVLSKGGEHHTNTLRGPMGYSTVYLYLCNCSMIVRSVFLVLKAKDKCSA